MWNILTSIKLCGFCGVYGLYKVTIDLAVCYEFKSVFADVINIDLVQTIPPSISIELAPSHSSLLVPPSPDLPTSASASTGESDM